MESPQNGIYPFHPEDEHIKQVCLLLLIIKTVPGNNTVHFLQFAIHSADYAFTTATEPREKDSFGLDMRGRIMLVPADRFPQLVDKISEIYAVS
jgi:protein BCP1